jgi:hypothetical protein
MLRRYFHKAGPPAEGGKGHDNDKKEGHKAEEFPEVHDCFMIYGGQVANASARHRKQERREVCSVKVAAPVYLDWSDKPITFDQGDHPRPRAEPREVPEHEYRPRGVRCVVRPSSAVSHSRPDRGRNAAPWPGSSSSPSPRMAGGRLLRGAGGWFPPPDAGGRSGTPAHAKAGSGSPPVPARMMKILEVEGEAEDATRLASPHHRTSGHPPA